MITTLVVLFLTGTSIELLHAQTKPFDIEKFESIGVKSPLENRQINPQKSAPNSNSYLNDTLSWIDPVISFDVPDPIDPFLNFTVGGAPIYFGDVNGDGLTDFGFYGVSSWDERSSVDAKTTKTILYFGNNSESKTNQQFYSNVIPMGDLNGDGFADALQYVVSESGSKHFVWQIGSSIGLTSTETVQPIPVINNSEANFRQIQIPILG